MRAEFNGVQVTLVEPVEADTFGIAAPGGRVAVDVRLMYWDDFTGTMGMHHSVPADLPWSLADRPISELAALAHARVPAFLRELADALERSDGPPPPSG